MKLSDLKPGEPAVIVQMSGTELSQRIMEMGLTPGSKVVVGYEAPFGGAIAVHCRGSLIALRLTDASDIEVQRT